MFALHIFERLYPVRCNRKSNIRFLIDYNCENDKKRHDEIKKMWIYTKCLANMHY